MIKKNPLFIILLVYGFFSIATFLSWHTKGINSVTGDEPHYLVMSSGMINHGSLEQTTPYREEFKTREIYKHGLASKDAQPSPENTHAVLGPNGLFNIHNIGLPLLLAIPYLIGGVVGAKLLMILLGSLVVIAAWKFSALFSPSNTHRFWAVIAAAISLPLLPASNQIYPDVLAGLIALTGLYWFFTLEKHRTLSLDVLFSAAIAFLPWLQIKFAATCVVLVFAVSLKIYFKSKNYQRIAVILITTGISCIALAAYNHYAFGKISGPYQSGALEISRTSLMVFLGLHLDQNQGFIMQNPVALVGTLAVGWMCRLDRYFTFVWALVFASLIVPNSLHPAWYGGWSISGRFQWAAAITFIVPTILGLLSIAKKKEKIFFAIILASTSLQLYFFYWYAILGVNLYNKGTEAWFATYSIFYHSISNWMPMFYNSEWAFDYPTNYSWIILTATLLILGFFDKKRLSNTGSTVISVVLLMVLTSGFSDEGPPNENTFKLDQLPSRTGKIVNGFRVAEQGSDSSGYVNYGPYITLTRGDYQITFTYRSSASNSVSIGLVDVYDATSKIQLNSKSIQGTNDIPREVTVNFKSKNSGLNSFEFRTHWNGLSNIEIQNIVLKRM